MNPFFSLIIPVYNSEKYIAGCIKSVIHQNYNSKKYEIIIINDGSKDKTSTICNKFKKNKNIKIINNIKNIGVSKCRNIGIKNASGEYIIFLDSDDELKFGALNSIEKKLKNTNVDLLLSIYLKKKNIYDYLNKLNEVSIIPIKEKKIIFFKLLNKNSNFKAHCWNYILKRNFINQNKIYFKEIKVFEDQVFVSEILCKIKKFNITKNTFHIHKERLDSLGRSMKETTLISCLKVINEICIMIKNESLHPEQEKFLQARIKFMLNFFKLYLIFCDKKKLNIVFNFIKKNIYNFSFIDQKLFGQTLKKKKINSIYNKLVKLVDKTDVLFDITNIKRSSLIYIFGAGLLGRVTCKKLQKNNVNIDAFLDNNKYFHNQKCLDIKIIKPAALDKFGKSKLRNLLIIISEENIILVKKILNQLRAYGVKRENIKTINWKKILSWT